MLDVIEIMKILPHRFPFLMVDRIVEMDPGNRIVGIKNVSINEPFFPGHFPGYPVMPGVLIIEAMAQVAGILGILTFDENDRDKITYFTGIDNAKFRRPVLPGDQLRLELEKIDCKRGIWFFKGKAFVDGKLEAPRSLLPDVHRHYFEPQYPEFSARTMWSLSNAFTSAFKELEPIPQYKATAKLAGFLEAVRA